MANEGTSIKYSLLPNQILGLMVRGRSTFPETSHLSPILSVARSLSESKASEMSSQSLETEASDFGMSICAMKRLPSSISLKR